MARSSDSFFLLAILKDKTFQAREIRRVIGLATLYLIVTTVLLGVFYHLMLGKLVEGTAPLFFVSEDMQRFNEMVPGMASVLGKWIIVMLIVNVIITACVGIYITRKLGHPIMAIKRALRDIGNGELDVRLRDSDSRDFSDIAHALNDAMVEIRHHIATAKSEIDQIAEVQERPASNDSCDEELLDIISSCKEALDFFNVEDKPQAAEQ